MVFKPIEMAQHFVKMIYDRQIKEATSNDEDVVLSGLMGFLSILLKKFPDTRKDL